jgi:hypothetical protein
MKTLFNFLTRIKDESIWLDPDGKYVYVEGTSWFDGIYYNPTVYYFYPGLIKTNENIGKLMVLDRYTFSKYMTRINVKQ